ncbi:MAG TPA: hypothetical protein VF245_03825 [Solirubrobacterales bacterium]
MPSAVAVVAALAALLAFAPFASATSDPVASGTTSVTLNKGFYKKLKKAGIKVLKVSPAKVKNRKITLGVASGSMDPTNGLGSLELSGGFKLKLGKKQAPVKGLVLDTAQSKLTGKVANKQMKIATVSGLTFARNGFGVNVNVAKMKLTGNAAKQLNKKLGFTGNKKGGKKSSASVSKTTKPPFKGGQVLGSSFSETQPKTVAVIADGSKAELLTNEATVKKFVTPIGLGGLGVEIKTVSPAETQLTTNPFTPKLLFPISGGNIAPNASGGIVQTSGAVTLHQIIVPGEKETTMTLNAIYVDLGAKTATVEVKVESTVDPKLNLGSLGRSSIADLSLTGATITSDPTSRKVSVANATATLQAVTAETLNSVFGSPLEALKIPYNKFAPGDGLGVFSFVAQTQ